MIFIHEHTFIIKNGRYYTSGSLNNKLFQRYKNWFGEVTVFATKRHATKDDERHICEQNEVACVHFTLVEKRNNVFSIIKNRKKVKQAVSSQDYLVIRIPSVYGIMAIIYARKFNKPYLIEMVGCPWDAFWNHSWKGKLVAPFMWYATKKAIKNAPYVVYVTNEYLQGRYPCKGKTIGCSDVSLPTLDKNILRKRLNKIHYTSDNKPVVLGTAAAVNVRYKGQEYVIRAIAKLNKQGYDFEYHLAGGGDNSFLKFVAEKYGVTDKVKFIGSLTHEKIFNYLDDIDIYIQPSKTEGMPRALIEAMSRGCPCIGSSAGGIPELLEKDYVFTRGKYKEIIPILARINRSKMLDQAKRNFEFAKRFDKKILDDRRNGIYPICRTHSS